MEMHLMVGSLLAALFAAMAYAVVRLPRPAAGSEMLFLRRPEDVEYLAGAIEMMEGKFRPQRLTDEVLSSGDAGHPHQFAEVPWDPRLGASVTDFDLPEVTMGMATFKTLMHCDCGAEKIKKVRALY